MQNISHWFLSVSLVCVEKKILIQALKHLFIQQERQNTEKCLHIGNLGCKGQITVYSHVSLHIFLKIVLPRDWCLKVLAPSKLLSYCKLFKLLVSFSSPFSIVICCSLNSLLILLISSDEGIRYMTGDCEQVFCVCRGIQRPKYREFNILLYWNC